MIMPRIKLSGQPGQAQTMLFTGQQFDNNALGQGEGGLYYLRARYYDPTLGRFLTQDPMRGSVAAPQTMNAYAYALNNPTNRVDPTGFSSEVSGGGFTGSGLDDAFFEELLFQECIKFVAVALILAAFGLVLLGMPLVVYASTGSLVLTSVVAIEGGIMFLASEGAAAGVGYSAYQLCAHRAEQATS